MLPRCMPPVCCPMLFVVQETLVEPSATPFPPSPTPLRLFDSFQSLARSELLQEYHSAIETSCWLYVGNLSHVTTEAQIYHLFSLAGEVNLVVMGIAKNQCAPCGFCFVEYVSVCLLSCSGTAAPTCLLVLSALAHLPSPWHVRHMHELIFSPYWARRAGTSLLKRQRRPSDIWAGCCWMAGLSASTGDAVYCCCAWNRGCAERRRSGRNKERLCYRVLTAGV